MKAAAPHWDLVTILGQTLEGEKKKNIRTVLLLTYYKSVINKVDYLRDIILLLLFNFLLFNFFTFNSIK